MTKKEIALDFFSQGYNCAQSVLSAFATETDIDLSSLLRVSTGFGGGIARTGDLCGAVTGGIMAISVSLNPTTSESLEGRAATYDLTQEFLNSFETKFGSHHCLKILGVNLQTPEGQEEFSRSNLRERCESCVGVAASMLDNLIDSSKHKAQ